MACFVIAWFLLFLGSFTGFFGRKYAVVFFKVGVLFQTLASLLLAFSGIQAMNGGSWEWVPLKMEFIGDIALGADSLSGIFLLILGVTGFSATLFSLDYLPHHYNRWNFHWLPVLNGLFIASMAGVFVSQNVLVFLGFWEMMALSSLGLVVLESLHERERRTGFIYITMTHAAAGFLFLALLWPTSASGGGFGFLAWKNGMELLSPFSRNLIFACLLIGFGTKAGIIPFHVWLPRAHPQAPANVSALMSGVMVKTGVYGILKFMAIPFFPIAPEWGWLILALGTVSAILGVMYAINERHLKALLAYSTVENVGIIFIGIGMGFLLNANGAYIESTIAFTAALFHALNHAMFKSLLFMAAGAIQSRTKTGNMDDMGGLAKTMPQLSVLFFIGAVAISALPPMSGFASEWLIYRSLISGFTLSSFSFKIAMPILAAILALAGALAGACFVSAFGTVFLGKARSAYPVNPSESNSAMLWGMAVPALCCLLLGVMPELVTEPFSRFDGRVGFKTLVAAPLSWKNSPDDSLAPLLILSSLAGGVLLGFFLLKWRNSRPEIEIGETWNCGTPRTERMSYTSTAFAEPFKVNFSFLFAPKRYFTAEGKVSPLIPTRIEYHMNTRKVFEEFLYKPAINLLLSLSHKVQRLQAGSLNAYLLLMFAVILVLLIAGV